VLYNTSFNLFGEPLVCTPRDAVRSFYSSGIDANARFLSTVGRVKPEHQEKFAAAIPHR